MVSERIEKETLHFEVVFITICAYGNGENKCAYSKYAL